MAEFPLISDDRLIGDASPFRRLPMNMRADQAMFFDGIRYSIEMIDLAYWRLRQHLFEITAEALSVPVGAVGSFLDAWSIIDNANRLRTLVDVLPGLKKKEAEPQLLLRRLETVEGARNGVQHLSTEIPKNLREPLHTWGFLTWLALMEDATLLMTLVSGRTMNISTRSSGVPFGVEVQGPVDLVELHAFGKVVSLTDVWKTVRRFAPWLEQQLEEAVRLEQPGGSDLLIRVELPPLHAGASRPGDPSAQPVASSPASPGEAQPATSPADTMSTEPPGSSPNPGAA